MTSKLREHLAQLAETIQAFGSELESVAQLGKTIALSMEEGHKLMAAGNGGSAAEALHLCEELTGRFRRNRRSLPALCLNADSTAITCIANDYGFDQIFARQLEGLGNRGDVYVAFSTSGKSENIIRSLQYARDNGIRTALITGAEGGPGADFADQIITVPSLDSARIQEMHTFILHSLLEVIESTYKHL